MEILDEIKYSKEVTKENYKKFSQKLPPKIAKKESKIFKKIKKLNDEPLKKLIKLYSFMDELYGFVEPFTACKKGCSYCCHIPISISEIEIRYIEISTAINRKNRMPILSTNSACPFLKNDTCSIYRYRPFMCRRHVSLDKTPKWCKPNLTQKSEMFMLRFSEIDKCYDHIVDISGGDQKIFDIRDVFLT